MEVGKAENIKISELGARNIVEKWQRTGIVADIYSESRILKRMKITEQDTDRLDQAIYENRELTAKQVKDQLQLQASESSIWRYIKRLGWRN